MVLGYFTDSTPLTPLRDPFNVLVDEINDNAALVAGQQQNYNFRWANAAARTAQAGMRVGDFGYQVDTTVTYRYSGSTWVAWSSPAISYTPTLTNFTIGTGGSASNTANYRYVNGRILVIHRAILGSSGFSVGTQVSMTLPVAAAAFSSQYKWLEGIGSAYDVSAAGISNALNHRFNAFSTTSVIILQNPYIPTNISATSPFTWAAGDVMEGSFWYDPA